MVALVQRRDQWPLTSHLTFLTSDGHKAEVERPKLFPAGASPVSAGVWFGCAIPDREFIVAEGVETTLSAMTLFDLSAGVAALSAIGLEALELPPQAQCIRIFADHDLEGHGLNAAREASRRWRREGRAVAISIADNAGEDANDILMRRLGLRP